MGREYEKYPKEHYERLSYLAEKIKKLHEEGVDVSSTGIRESKYSRYYSAARDRDITWSEVLVAAGIPPSEVEKKPGGAKKSVKTRRKTKKRGKKKKLKKELRDAEDTDSKMFCEKDGSLYGDAERVEEELFKYCPKCDKWYHIEE